MPRPAAYDADSVAFRDILRRLADFDEGLFAVVQMRFYWGLGIRRDRVRTLNLAVGRLNATGRLREVGCVTRLGNRLGAQSGGRALWRIHARVQPGRHAATLASAPQTNGCRPSLTTSSSANRHDTNTPPGSPSVCPLTAIYPGESRSCS